MKSLRVRLDRAAMGGNLAALEGLIRDVRWELRDFGLNENFRRRGSRRRFGVRHGAKVRGALKLGGKVNIDGVFSDLSVYDIKRIRTPSPLQPVSPSNHGEYLVTLRPLSGGGSRSAMMDYEMRIVDNGSSMSPFVLKANGDKLAEGDVALTIDMMKQAHTRTSTMQKRRFGTTLEDALDKVAGFMKQIRTANKTQSGLRALESLRQALVRARRGDRNAWHDLQNAAHDVGKSCEGGDYNAMHRLLQDFGHAVDRAADLLRASQHARKAQRFSVAAAKPGTKIRINGERYEISARRVLGRGGLVSLPVRGDGPVRRVVAHAANGAWRAFGHDGSVVARGNFAARAGLRPGQRHAVGMKQTHASPKTKTIAVSQLRKGQKIAFPEGICTVDGVQHVGGGMVIVDWTNPNGSKVSTAPMKGNRTVDILAARTRGMKQTYASERPKAPWMVTGPDLAEALEQVGQGIAEFEIGLEDLERGLRSAHAKAEAAGSKAIVKLIKELESWTHKAKPVLASAKALRRTSPDLPTVSDSWAKWE